MQWVDVTDKLYDENNYDNLEEQIEAGGHPPWGLDQENPNFSLSLKLGTAYKDLFHSAEQIRITYTLEISSSYYTSHSFLGKTYEIDSDQNRLYVIPLEDPGGGYFYSGSRTTPVVPSDVSFFPLEFRWTESWRHVYSEITLSKVELLVKDPIFWTKFVGQTEYA